MLRYCRGIVRFLEFEAGFLEPTKVRRARIVQKGLTLREPAPHPSLSHLGVRSKTKSDHEDHWKAGQRAAGPPGTIFQMMTRGTNGCGVETDHEKRTVCHLAGELNHAGPSGQQIDRRRCCTSIPETGRRWTELDAFSGEQSAKIENCLAHDSHRCARFPDTARRNKTWCHSKIR